MTAPDIIMTLAPNEVFVFGSNIHGRHGAGAARFAVERFGAEYGNGEGLQGQSYALPTMEGWESFQEAVTRFLAYAESRPDLTFLMTEVGCGLAGYTVEEVAPLFSEVPPNVELPPAFEEFLA